MLKDIVEKTRKKSRGKEKLYVHITMNQEWLKGFLYGTGNTMGNFTRPTQYLFRDRVKSIKSPCSIKLVISTMLKVPGQFYVHSNGEFGQSIPNGAKARDVERVAREVVEEMIDSMRHRG